MMKTDCPRYSRAELAAAIAGLAKLDSATLKAR